MNLTCRVALTTALFAGASLARAALIHAYEFNGNLNDSVGSLALTANGATPGATDTALTFGANQGPSFFGEAGLAANYSIGLRFSLDTTSGYRKIVDYKNRGSDAGTYVLNGRDDFYPVGTGSLLPTSGFMDLVITRDATTGLYNSYLNGAQSLTFTDSSNLAVAALSGGNAVFRFFQDDFATSQGEASGGRVDEIRVWDNALSAQEVTTAFAPLPTHQNVPDTGPGVCGIAAMVAPFVCHRRRRR